MGTTLVVFIKHCVELYHVTELLDIELLSWGWLLTYSTWDLCVCLLFCLFDFTVYVILRTLEQEETPLTLRLVSISGSVVKKSLTTLHDAARLFNDKGCPPMEIQLSPSFTNRPQLLKLPEICFAMIVKQRK